MGDEEKHFAAAGGRLNCIDCVCRGNHFCVSDTKRYTLSGQIEFLDQPLVVYVFLALHFISYHIPR